MPPFILRLMVGLTIFSIPLTFDRTILKKKQYSKGCKLATSVLHRKSACDQDCAEQLGSTMATQIETTIRILVVDDEPTITEFLETGLTYEGFTVRTVGDGKAALEVAHSFRPEIVILDIMLPGIDGWDVCRKLRQESDVGIIMLTARGDLEDRVTGLDNGADDYLVKPFKFKELLARVRSLLRRRRVAMPHILQNGDLKLDRDTREVTLSGQPVHLTPREFDVLELLMSHPRQALTRETMLNRVWGYNYIGETNVVEVHISSVREKLSDRDRQRIQTVRGVGYMLRG
ncbi:MAG: response regulator transcription factor [Herpetosiphon sp.]